MTQLDMLDVLAMAEDMNDPTRIVAQTTIGSLMISTVRTPMRATYETCIFHNVKRYSEVVDSEIAEREKAVNAHLYWVKKVHDDGWVFDQDCKEILNWIGELKHAGCFDADYLITPQM